MAHEITNGSNSIDPTEPPIINPRYNSHSADIAVMAAGLKMADKTSKSKHLNGKFAERLVPDPKYDLEDTKQAREAAEDW